MPAEHCLHLRACPRCHGAMKADRDQYGPYRVCIACGYVFYPPGQSAMTSAQAQAEVERHRNQPIHLRKKAKVT